MDPRTGEFVGQLDYMAKHPPGDDQYMGWFYEAVKDLIQNDPNWQSLVGRVLTDRVITDSHFANLLMRAEQKRLMQDPEYPENIHGPDDWKTALQRTYLNDRDGFLEDLLTKDTGTTIYRRYAGPKIIIGAIWPADRFPEGVQVLDVGCGRNYGLRGMAQSIPFTGINGATGEIGGWLNNPVNIHRGVAVDKVDYRTPEAEEWGLACGFRPTELRKALPEVLDLEKRLNHANGVEFHQINYENLLTNGLELKNLDAVIASTVLYQDPEGQRQLMGIAKQVLKPSGVLIVQDFARHPPGNGHLEFRDDWATPFSYRTLVTGERFAWSWKEVLQWSDGRCRDVRPGQDYETFEKAVREFDNTKQSQKSG